MNFSFSVSVSVTLCSSRSNKKTQTYPNSSSRLDNANMLTAQPQRWKLKSAGDKSLLRTFVRVMFRHRNLSVRVRKHHGLDSNTWSGRSDHRRSRSDEYLVLTPQKCQKQLIETIRCLRAARPALTDRQHVIYSLFLKPNSSLTEAAQSKNAQLDLQNKCEPRTFLQNHKWIKTERFFHPGQS